MQRKQNKTVVCADGFRVSIQASESHYSIPRVDNAERYTEVELGYPSQVDQLIIDYAEDETNPTATVYGYVPSDIVYALLTKHGGVVEGDVPNGIFYYGLNKHNS